MPAEVTGVDEREDVFPDHEVLELVADLAEAPDFASASGLMLEQLTNAAGGGRGALLVIDGSGQHLEIAASHGLAPDDTTRLSSALQRTGHPLMVSATALDVVICRADASAAMGVPFAGAVAIPFSQPRSRSAFGRTLEGAASIAEAYDGCELFPLRETGRGHVGRAPFAVAVLEGCPDEMVLGRLARVAVLAGSVLARVFVSDGLRRSAERLDDQRRLLTTIVNALPDPIIITDATNDIVVSNQRAETLLVSTDHDSYGRRRAVEINNLLFSSFLSKAVLTGGVKSTARELTLVDPDEGMDLLFEVLAHPLPPATGRQGAFVSVLRDVTDLKRASAELERQFQRGRVTEMEATRERDRLNLILNNVGDPILVTDDQSKIMLMNPQAELLFELPATAHDRQWAQRVRANDTKFTTVISDFTISPVPFRRERLTLANPRTGVEEPMEVVAGKVLNERGEPLAIVSVLHDLTKQVENERLYLELKKFSAELEDRIRMATADLEAQNLRLQWQSSELEKAYKLKSEFLANMSHELRTPINALIGYTALMLDRIYGELTPKQVEGLNRIQASSQHLLALINDILDLAKIEAGKMPVHLESLTLQTVLGEVVTQIDLQVKRKGLDFRCDIAEDVPVLFTDRTKLKQIVLNLLSNAVKFTHNGSVALTAEVAGADLRLMVRDTGIGIHPEHLQVIFEEFRQVDQSRTREYGGTGLGLSITRKLIALLGGAIRVESIYGTGTTFTITLPLHSEALPMDEQVVRTMIGSARGVS
ncbi:MAG TPA: ATP-binding protein [Gemmatimonadaceae bacterium]|nr:ATP-binding protein [Gemmatimonadaceae bacterium]